MESDKDEISKIQNQDKQKTWHINVMIYYKLILNKEN